MKEEMQPSGKEKTRKRKEQKEQASALRCPDCGTPFSLPAGEITCFCQKCGARLLVDAGQLFIMPKVMVTGRMEKKAEATDEEEKARKHSAQLLEEADKTEMKIGSILIFALFLIVTVVLFIVLNRF